MVNKLTDEQFELRRQQCLSVVSTLRTRYSGDTPLDRLGRWWFDRLKQELLLAENNGKGYSQPFDAANPPRLTSTPPLDGADGR